MIKCPTNIFDGLDGVAHLHVEVAVEDPRQSGAVGYDPTVVHCHLLPSFQNSERLASVLRGPPSVGWVSVLFGHCLRAKFLGELFGAFAIFHAWSLWVQASTRPMHHVTLHDFVQLWVAVLVWQFGTDDLVYRIKSGSLSSPQQQMEMGKAPKMIYSVI